MNPQQQQQSQGPSTPQRIFPNPSMQSQGRPITIANQQFNNRSFSPHTPSSSQPAQQQQQLQQQQQQQLIRTPIQLMQQQTKQIVNSPNKMNSNQASQLINSNKRLIAPSNPNGGLNNAHIGQASPAPNNLLQSQQIEAMNRAQNRLGLKKKAKLKDKVIPQKVRDLVPDSQSYMDLLAFERKLDATILRKRLDIQEALKRPMKIKKKLRVFITNQMHPGRIDGDTESEDCLPQWEVKIEGRLLEDTKAEAATINNLNKVKPRKFSSFFKSLVIELDKDLYGPDNHLVEWHRTPQTAETDGKNKLLKVM